MKWQDKLSKRELSHLRKSGVTTLTVARANAEHQLKLRRKPESIEPCWDCKSINRKLGLAV